MAEIFVNTTTVPGLPTDTAKNDCAGALNTFFSGLSSGTVVIFPRGKYLVNSTMASLIQTQSSITIRGEGPNSSLIQLGPSFSLNSVIEVRGSDDTTRNHWFRMQDIGFVGSANIAFRYDPVLFLQFCSNVRLDRVDFFNIPGPGVHAHAWKNSVCRDLHFRRMWNPNRPLFIVDPPPLSISDISENLKFEACQFEKDLQSLAYFENARNLYFSGCKFHGPLNEEDENSQAHLFFKKCYLMSVMDSRFTSSGVELIRADDSSGLLVTGSVFDHAYRNKDVIEPNKACIRLTNTGYSIVTGNFFGDDPKGIAVAPVYPTNISTNIISENTQVPNP